MPYAKVQAQRSAMVGRSQLGGRGWGRLRRPLQYEKERGDGMEMWRKDEGKSGKTASGAGLYTSRKRRVRRCRALCPKRRRQTRRGHAWPGSRKERAFHQDADYYIIYTDIAIATEFTLLHITLRLPTTLLISQSNTNLNCHQ